MIVTGEPPVERSVGRRVALTLFPAMFDAHCGGHWTRPGVERLTIQVCRTHVLLQVLLSVGETLDVGQLARGIAPVPNTL